MVVDAGVADDLLALQDSETSKFWAVSQVVGPAASKTFHGAWTSGRRCGNRWYGLRYRLGNGSRWPGLANGGIVGGNCFMDLLASRCAPGVRVAGQNFKFVVQLVEGEFGGIQLPHGFTYAIEAGVFFLFTAEIEISRARGGGGIHSEGHTRLNTTAGCLHELLNDVACTIATSASVVARGTATGQLISHIFKIDVADSR